MKGSGQLKKKVLRCHTGLEPGLQLPEVKKTYHRIDKDRDPRSFIRGSAGFSCGSSTDPYGRVANHRWCFVPLFRCAKTFSS